MEKLIAEKDFKIIDSETRLAKVSDIISCGFNTKEFFSDEVTFSSFGDNELIGTTFRMHYKKTIYAKVAEKLNDACWGGPVDIDSLERDLDSAYGGYLTQSLLDDFSNKVKKSLNLLSQDSEENEFRKLNTSYSKRSLCLLARYVPSTIDRDYSIYIDEQSSLFGIVFKGKKVRKNKPALLNVLIEEDGRVQFSYVNKGNNIVKISGTGSLKSSPEDSVFFEKLVRMLDE